MHFIRFFKCISAWIFSAILELQGPLVKLNKYRLKKCTSKTFWKGYNLLTSSSDTLLVQIFIGFLSCSVRTKKNKKAFEKKKMLIFVTIFDLQSCLAAWPGTHISSRGEKDYLKVCRLYIEKIVLQFISNEFGGIVKINSWFVLIQLRENEILLHTLNKHNLRCS